MPKKRFPIIALFFGCFLTIELIARFFGLCDYPLYISNPAYEYMHAPNQRHLIYRNKFVTNAWSMRNDPIDNDRDTTVVLLIGDSVINGGNLTDHDSLASTLLEKWLSERLKANIRVFNISAGSWGPDNAVAYLEEHGTFHADVMVLVCSSHDAYDNMEFARVVGIHPQFPDRQVSLAWEKIWKRGVQYITRQIQKPTKIEEAPKSGLPFNTGFSDLHIMARKADIPFILYLHPSFPEMENNMITPPGERIIQFSEKENIPLLQGINLGAKEDHYRDHIHFNEKGQRFLAEQLFPILLPLFNI